MNNNKISLNDYSLILEHLHDGILVFNNEGIIVFCNNALCNLYNVSPSEIIGKTSQELIDNKYVDHSFTDLVISTKKKLTYVQVCKTGKNIVNTAFPILGTDDVIQFVVEQCQSLDDLQFYAPNEITVNVPSSHPEETVTQKPFTLASFKSAAMQNVYKLADNMATKNINILILGASGTGKSQLARRVHNNSSRKGGPFVTINCSTIPGNLIESELFGYMKGAFSGASNTGKKGLVEVANHGTLFLDEIGELPLELQSKLLQLVQDKTYLPIGGVNPKQIDTRIIAATNQDIPSLISQGNFREDLYYRLAVVTIVMPPLKNRSEDILQLIKHFGNAFNVKHETNVSFSTETIKLLCEYSWPGNIREMEHLIEFLILNSYDNYVTPRMLPLNIYSSCQTSNGLDHNESIATNRTAEIITDDTFDTSTVKSFAKFIETQESKLLQALYSEYNTSYKLASRLNISQSKANRLIRKYITND